MLQPSCVTHGPPQRQMGRKRRLTARYKRPVFFGLDEDNCRVKVNHVSAPRHHNYLRRQNREITQSWCKTSGCFWLEFGPEEREGRYFYLGKFPSVTFGPDPWINKCHDASASSFKSCCNEPRAVEPFTRRAIINRSARELLSDWTGSQLFRTSLSLSPVGDLPAQE